MEGMETEAVEREAGVGDKAEERDGRRGGRDGLGDEEDVDVPAPSSCA